jgi:predicted MPP superfamily phosphohydrolase
MNETASPRRGAAAAGVRLGLLAAAAFVLYGLFIHGVGEPLHAAGTGQRILAYLNGLNYVLQAPGWSLARALGLRLSPYTPATWWAGLALGVPFSFSVAFLGRALWALTYRPRPPPAPAAEPAPSRRLFLKAGLQLAGGGAAAGLAYALVGEPRWYTVTHRPFPIRGLPASLDGLRLVQLSDIHHGPWLTLSYVREIVRACNDLHPDLVLLTGDYILKSSAYVRPVVEELARLRPVLGTLAVLGNHDWYEGVGLTRKAFAEAGLPLIDNARKVLTPDRQLVDGAAEGLALCGVDDLWRGRPNYARALARLPDDMPRLLLSHNPDVAEEEAFVRSGLRVDLMISGHTHGGQVYVPGFGTPFIPSRYGQKYAQGLVRGPTCPVFVCRGLGLSTLPLRIGVPPEIAVFELHDV